MNTRTSLATCRDERASACGRAFLALLRQRAGVARERLVRAAPDQVAHLQGAVLALEDVLREVESDGPVDQGPDGGYA